MQIKTSCVFWPLQMANATYQCSEHLLGMRSLPQTVHLEVPWLSWSAVAAELPWKDSKTLSALVHNQHGRGRQLGSFLSCSHCCPSEDASEQGQTFSTCAVSCSWVCGTPMSWLLHVFVIGKTHIWFQFCSSEGPGRERPARCGMDVKGIKHDFQLPVE